jgi:hypothetical protein
MDERGVECERVTPDESEDSSCPCVADLPSPGPAEAQHPAAPRSGEHILCAECQEVVRRAAGRAARKFGRRSSVVYDLVQDVYAERLLDPDCLAKFRPPRDPEQLRPAFRGWLSTVAYRLSLNKLARPEASSTKEAVDTPNERTHRRTGSREFNRSHIGRLLKQSYECVREDYARRGRLEYFDKLAPLLLGPEPELAEAARHLGNLNAARQARFKMQGKWDYELRLKVLDELDPPPGLSQEEREALIDQEIRELLDALSADGEEDA